MTSTRHPSRLTRRGILVGIGSAPLLLAGAVWGQPAVSSKQSAPPGDDGRTAVNRLVTDDLLWDQASPVLGNPRGDVTMAEFFDYRCPYCKVMAPKLLDLVAKDSGLRMVMKEYPILSRESVFAAKVALVAHRHGAYPAYHAGMFALTGRFDEQAILHVADVAGLSPTVAKAEMNEPEILGELRRNLALGQLIGVRGTPAFAVGGKVIAGAVSLDVLQAAIDKTRQLQKG